MDVAGLGLHAVMGYSRAAPGQPVADHPCHQQSQATVFFRHYSGGRCAKKLNTADTCKNNPLKVLQLASLLKYAIVFSLKSHIYFLFIRFYPFFCAGPGATR
jgi:hypothetical protein